MSGQSFPERPGLDPDPCECEPEEEEEPTFKDVLNLLTDLLQWASDLGGWESPVWERTDAMWNAIARMEGWVK